MRIGGEGGKRRRGERMSFLVEGGFSLGGGKWKVPWLTAFDGTEVKSVIRVIERIGTLVRVLFCVGNRFTGVLRIMQRFS